MLVLYIILLWCILSIPVTYNLGRIYGYCQPKPYGGILLIVAFILYIPMGIIIWIMQKLKGY